MCFQDFPMPEETSFYPHHTQVMNYLSELALQENLSSLIRYQTLVENVEYKNDVWKVTVNNAQDGDRYTEEFDAVVVATGHYAVPYVPDIPGLEELNKNRHIQILHSRDYRCPDEFKNKVLQRWKWEVQRAKSIDFAKLHRLFLL